MSINLSMFRKTNKLPQRKHFELSPQQILDDILDVRDDEVQREKLYLCMDEKPPHENKFNKVKNFLRVSNDLEGMLEKLHDINEELIVLEKRLESGNSNIRSAILEKMKV